jgi:hypothetical protein
MTKQTQILVAVLASVAIIEFFMIIIMLGLITPVLLIMLLLAMGILFPMAITRYTGGFICLAMKENSKFGDQEKSMLMSACMIVGSIATILMLNYAFKTSINDPVDLNEYFSVRQAVAISIIGSITGLVIAKKTELMRQFMGFF